MKHRKIKKNIIDFKVVLISINIVLVAGALGILFNIFNPLGIEIRHKVCPPKIIKVIKIFKKDTTDLQVTAVTNVSTSTVTNQNTNTTKETLTNISQPIMEYIDLKTAKELFDKGKAIFIDARPQYRYIEGHIKGAISLSASMFIKQYEEVKDKIFKDDILVIYCSGTPCNLSDKVAANLKEKGFLNLKIFSGGWDSWVKEKYPVEGIRVNQ